MLTPKQRLLRQLRFKKEMGRLKETWRRRRIQRYPVVIVHYREINNLRRI